LQLAQGKGFCRKDLVRRREELGAYRRGLFAPNEDNSVQNTGRKALAPAAATKEGGQALTRHVGNTVKLESKDAAT